MPGTISNWCLALFFIADLYVRGRATKAVPGTTLSFGVIFFQTQTNLLKSRAAGVSRVRLANRENLILGNLASVLEDAGPGTYVSFMTSII